MQKTMKRLKSLKRTLVPSVGRRSVTIILSAGLLSLLLGLTLPTHATGRRPVGLQTVPTRTPTSAPQPSRVPGGGGDGSGGATPTSTRGGPTASPSATAGFVPRTPVGGYLPTAQPCGLPPTARAVGRVNVREGPGLNYPYGGTLLLNEVRPIVGRADDIAWWLIELPDGSKGWVADRVVAVSGYTGLVPTVQAPPLDSATPTRGAPWRPTPNPACTPPAEDATKPESTATATRTLAPPTEMPSPGATHTASRTPTSQAAEAMRSQSNVEATPNVVDNSSEEPSDGGGSLWLLFAGLGLIVAGGVFLILRRRS